MKFLMRRNDDLRLRAPLRAQIKLVFSSKVVDFRQPMIDTITHCNLIEDVGYVYL
jgi:hypothetical protein